MTIAYRQHAIIPVMQCQMEAHYLIGLNEYVHYGLEMRKLLEHLGPYDLSPSTKKSDYKGRSFIGSVRDKKALDSHQITYQRLSSESLVVSGISLFEYFIAGIFIQLFEYSKLDNGEITRGLDLVWDNDKKNEFRTYCIDNNVGEDNWLQTNHNWENQKSRLKQLGKHLSFELTDLKNNKLDYGWDNFCSMRQKRIDIVHSTKRQSIFQGRERSEVNDLQDKSLKTIYWIEYLADFIESRIYKLPILIDKERGLFDTKTGKLIER